MALVAIEEAGTRIRWTMTGRDVHTAKSLATLVDKIAEPSAFICDPEFFYGLRDVRRGLEDWFAASGHELVPVTRKVQEVLARAAGVDKPSAGVASLHSVVTQAARSLDQTAVETSAFWDVRDAVAVAFAVDRFTNASGSDSNTVNVVRAALEFDETTRSVLVDGGDYRRDVLYAACRAASVACDRNAYERLLGLSGEAHGMLPRVVRGWYAERNTTDAFERESVLRWSDYRRALRRVFHAAKSSRTIEGTARAS